MEMRFDGTGKRARTDFNFWKLDSVVVANRPGIVIPSLGNDVCKQP